MNGLATRLSVLVVVLLATRQGWGEQPKANPAEEKALRDAHRTFLAAFNKGDAEAVAAFYAPDADLIGPTGQLSKGRAQIEKTHADFFAKNKGIKLKSPFGSVRFITPDVAIADRTGELTPASDGGTGKVHATIVYVKSDGKWLMAGVRLMVPFQESKR